MSSSYSSNNRSSNNNTSNYNKTQASRSHRQEMNRSRSSHRNQQPHSGLVSHDTQNRRPISYDRSYKSNDPRLQKRNSDDLVDEYVDCKAMLDAEQRSRPDKRYDTRPRPEMTSSSTRNASCSSKTSNLGKLFINSYYS